MNSCPNPSVLATKVLEELPDQVVQYMRMKEKGLIWLLI
jgi:hypothetical protein